MSLARIGCDGSDVYVYWDSETTLSCECGQPGRYELAPAAMVAHLKQHQANGDGLPPDLIEDIEAIARNRGLWPQPTTPPSSVMPTFYGCDMPRDFGLAALLTDDELADVTSLDEDED